MLESSRASASHSPGDWFRLVVEAAPNAMVMVDRSQTIVLINRATERLFGYDRLELIGQPVDRLVPENARLQHPRHVADFLTRPQARAMGAGRELHGRTKDGHDVPIEIGLNPIETPEGLFTLASIIDISERKRASAAHERLASIVEYSSDAIVSMTLDGVLTSWNQAAEHLFGFSADEAIGASVIQIVPQRLVNEELELIERTRRGERIESFATVRRRKDHSEVDAWISMSPIRGYGGQIVGASSIIRDITEAKRRDAELQRSNAELEQFAYVASHDLQEPLRMVANYTELLAQRYKGQLDERADKYIHYASDGARRMQRLVADLLAYSRVGSQGKALLPVDCGPVVDRVLHSLRRLIVETGTVVQVEALPRVLADEVQLGQLFQNLIGNAIKFRSEAPPVVVIAASREGQRWCFRIRDNGIGMEMQYAERIFQMFQRLHEIGKYEGSGIGLAIAKRIVDRHGGRISVESEPGAGTTFSFDLQGAP
ncbi:MAG: PAS domain S-box protein [Gemmatimonadaceae bacterium]|nr:PAS domain S-box protein [Gemmatimonadaceae bacterium]